VKPAGTRATINPFHSWCGKSAEKDSSLALVRDGKAVPLTLGEEAYFNSRLKLGADASASGVSSVTG